MLSGRRLSFTTLGFHLDTYLFFNCSKMSNAVILEGTVLKVEENSSWSGVWRFAKDKKGALQFNYKVYRLFSTSFYMLSEF